MTTQDGHVFVHIGRAKTGSTAVQTTLATNRSALADLGFHYPGDGPNHGFLAWHLDVNLRRVATSQQAAEHARVAAELRSNIGNVAGSLIFSSEGLQNVAPATLREWLGNIDNVTIIVYIREQMGYLASAYSQRVKAGSLTESFESFASRFTIDYREILSDLAEVFGRQRLVVRRYCRRHLINGDSVDDFLSVIGVDKRNLSIPTTDANPSIGGALLEAKRRINALGLPAQSLQNASYQYLLELSRNRPEYRGGVAVAPDVVAAVRSRYAESNAEVSSIYFDGGPLFDLRPVASPSDIAEEEVSVAIREIATGVKQADSGLAELIDELASATQPGLVGRLRRVSGLIGRDNSSIPTRLLARFRRLRTS